MRLFLLSLLLLALMRPATAAPDPKAPPSPAWSPPVHGLRARIFTAPSHEPELDKTFDVLIEFQEVGLDTSLGLEHRSLTVRFSRPQFKVTVTDAKANPVIDTKRPGETSVPPPGTWDLVLPPGGDITFPIGQGGSSPHVVPGQPPKGGLMSFDNESEWLIPDSDGPYHLAITFQISDSGSDVAGAASPPRDPASAAGTSPGATPAPAAATSYSGWTGTLVLPPIVIPQKK